MYKLFLLINYSIIIRENNIDCAEHQQALPATGIARGNIGKIGGASELGDEDPASDDTGESTR